MRKIIPVMIVTLVALASCSEEPGGGLAQPDGAIVFGTPAMSVETRSTFKDAIEASESFGVIGYCLAYTVGTTTVNYNSGAGNWLTKREYCPPSVFNRQRVTVESDGPCSYENIKYWYANGKGLDGEDVASVTNADNYRYTFFAYYPYDGAYEVEIPGTMKNEKGDDILVGGSPVNVGAPRLTFTMPQTGTSLAAVLDHSATPDAMLAALYDRRKSEGNLQFTFRHVLTGLGFVVNNYSTRHLLVNKVELRGTFYKRLIIDATTSTVTYESPSASPGDVYTGTYVVYDGGAGEVLDLTNDDPENVSVVSSQNPIGGEHVMLISGVQNQSLGPVANDENGYEPLEVVIHYKFWDNGDAEPSDWTVKAFTRPATFTFRSGTRYVARLDFVGDAFTIDFIQANGDIWQDGEADDGDETNDDVVFE